MKTAFLYAGQGAQSVGMGKDFYDKFGSFKAVVDEAEQILPFPLKQTMWEGPESELLKTDRTQPCMAVFAAGLTAVLEDLGIKPDVAAGLSLGEYGAFYAAGVWDLSTFIDIVAYRGMVMAQAAEGHTTAMSAVLGLQAEQVEQAVEAVMSRKAGFVTIANYNCPGQYVICGLEKGVAAAEEEALALGAKRCLRLKVGGPFHTSIMRGAGDKLREHFDTVAFHDPQIPVCMNFTGKFFSQFGDLKEALRLQVSSPVRFESCLRELMAAGTERFIEIGPGKALTGFAKRTAAALDVEPQLVSVTTVGDLEKLGY